MYRSRISIRTYVDLTKNQSSKKQTPKKPIAKSMHQLINEETDESSSLIEECPVVGQVEPRFKQPWGAKATLKKITPPRAMPRIKNPAPHYPINCPSLRKMMMIVIKKMMVSIMIRGNLAHSKRTIKRGLMIMMGLNSEMRVYTS